MTLNLLLILSISQSLFFSFILASNTNRKIFANIILSSMLLSLAISLSDILLQNLDIIIEYPHIAFIAASFGFLIAPLSFIFVQSLTQNKKALVKTDSIHLVPFITVNILLLFNYRLLESSEQVKILSDITQLNPTLSFSLAFLGNLQVFTYLGFSLLKLRKYHKNLPNIISNLEKHSLSWLKFIFTGILLIWLFDISRLLFGFYIDLAYYDLVQIAVIYFFVNTLIYKSLHNLTLFKFISDTIFNESETLEKIKYQRSSLTKLKMAKLIPELNEIMEIKKPYLDDDFNAPQLTLLLDIPLYQLSQLINQHYKCNFYDFINKHRVEHSKHLLLNSDLKILAVAFESGFSNKNSFNRSFKKFVSITPSEFREKKRNGK